MGVRFSFWVTLVCSAMAYAQAPESKSALEFWIYRPAVVVDDLKSESKPHDIPLTKEIVAKGAVEKLEITEVRWQDRGLVFGKIYGGIRAEELNGQTTVKVPIVNREEKVNLFSFRNVSLELKSNNPIGLAFPNRIALVAEKNGNGTSFSLADDSMKAHIDAQIDSVFSLENFDRFFSIAFNGELSDMARQLIQKGIADHKKKLLEQARNELKKALTKEQLAKLLVINSGALPKELPEEVLNGGWVLTREEVSDESGQAVTLWRLASAEASKERSSYRFPPLAADAKNRISVIASGPLVQWLIRTGAASKSVGEVETVALIPLGKTESSMLSRAFGLEAQAELSLITSGELGPRASLWSRTESNLPQRHFMDLLVHLREGTKDHRLGIILEIGPGGAPKLVQIFPLGGNKSVEQGESLRLLDGWKSLEQRVGQTLLQTVANSKLDEVHGKWTTGSDKLVPIGIRTVGDRGERVSQGRVGTDKWADALAVDFELR